MATAVETPTSVHDGIVADGPPIVDITTLRKSYGTNEVLKGIDLKVRKGEVVCIIGKSGSGKSTLLRCVNGLEVFQDGALAVNGRPLLHDSAVAMRALRQEVGHPALDRGQIRQAELAQNVPHPNRQGIENALKIERKIQLTGLDHAVYAGSLLAKGGADQDQRQYHHDNDKQHGRDRGQALPHPFAQTQIQRIEQDRDHQAAQCPLHAKPSHMRRLG